MKLQTGSVFAILLIILQKTVFIQTYYGDNKMPVKHFSTSHRFPHLQKVMDHINTEKQYVQPTDTASISSPFSRTSDGHAKAHEEEDDEEHIDEDDDEEEDNEDEEEDEEEDDEEESEGKTLKYHQSYQPHTDGRPPWESGRTTTTTTPRSTPSPTQPPMSSHSQFKWNTFGRRPDLDEYRNSRMHNYKKPTHNTDDASKALVHAQRVNRDILCRVPRAKVIHVKDIYPHPSKTYVPHCTVLHQCGDDTGCCRSETLSCVAKRTHPVELYFFSTSTTLSSSMDIGSRYRQPQPTASNVVVKLTFTNHTECICQNKHDDEMPRDMDPTLQRTSQYHLTTPSPSYTLTTTYRPSHHPYQSPPAARSQEVSTRSASETCRCPLEFYPRRLADGSCTCDCFDKQKECLRLKKGKEYFTHQDKLCIEKKLCHMPQCEFGSYIRTAGRCPRKQEKLSSWHLY